MAIYGEVLNFKELTREQVPLSSVLVQIIKTHHSKSREHIFHLCMIAYGLRKHNFVKRKTGAGGNALGYAYKPEFTKWYDDNDLCEVYGSFPANFTIYAMVGRLLTYTRWQVGEEYIDRLPKSLTALYELSQIIWSQGDAATDKSRALYKKALQAVVRDGSKNNKLVHPNATRKDINQWRMNITKTNPTNTQSTVQSKQITLPVATIKVHKDLLKLTKRTGEKRFGPKLDDVKELVTQLNDLISKFDAGKGRYVLESNLQDLEQKYHDATNHDFGKKIETSVAAKSSPAKKTVKTKG
jgi:hypothetical protein